MINEGDDAPGGYVFGRVMTEGEWETIKAFGNGVSHVDEHGVRRWLLLPAERMEAIRLRCLAAFGVLPNEIAGGSDG